VEKYIVERDRPQMTIWRVRISCWVPKATHTYSEYVIIIAFSTATLVMRTRLNVIRTLTVLLNDYIQVETSVTAQVLMP